MDMDNCRELVCGLRSLGLFMNKVMNENINKNQRQFLVACIVSHRELKEGTFHSVLADARNEFIYNLDGSVKASKRYFRLNRLVFLMNFRDDSQKDQHTEARLLDPKGNILRQLSNNAHGEPENENVEEFDSFDSGFLACLKRDFTSKFGTNESYSIAMFSYFLPCTQPDHMCAKLVGKFAELTKTDIIVSYEMPFMTTDKESSIQSMNGEYVTLLHPEDCDYFISENCALPAYSFTPWMRRDYNRGYALFNTKVSHHNIALHDHFGWLTGHRGTPTLHFLRNIPMFRHIPCDYNYVPIRAICEGPYFGNAINRQWQFYHQLY